MTTKSYLEDQKFEAAKHNVDSIVQELLNGKLPTITNNIGYDLTFDAFINKILTCEGKLRCLNKNNSTSLKLSQEQRKTADVISSLIVDRECENILFGLLCNKKFHEMFDTKMALGAHIQHKTIIKKLEACLYYNKYFPKLLFSMSTQDFTKIFVDRLSKRNKITKIQLVNELTGQKIIARRIDIWEDANTANDKKGKTIYNFRSSWDSPTRTFLGYFI